MTAAPRIGMVAGEASGDALGSGLIRMLRARLPGAEFTGIGGPLMEQAGCRIMMPMERLSVMGLVEVAGRYCELSAIRRRLAGYFISHPPDLFIGIDAPDFNLGLEGRLHAAGIRTVHYVGPQVWAWREYRLKNIARAVDLLLVLFPFEAAYFQDRGVRSAWVGHPLAASIDLEPDCSAARARLGVPGSGKLIAIMPGSRRTELKRLLKPFLLAAAACVRQDPEIRCVTSLLTRAEADMLERVRRRLGLEDLPLTVFVGAARDVLAAADAVLLASGTITLEAMLYKKPMVVAYRLHPLTYGIVRTLVRVDYASLPNLLAGRALVPECLQARCTPQRLSAELMRWLSDAPAVAALREEFTRLHRSLLPEYPDQAARAVLELLARA